MKSYIETNVKPRIKVLAELGPGVVTTRLMEMTVNNMKKVFPSESDESIKKALEDADVKVGVKL